MHVHIIDKCAANGAADTTNDKLRWLMQDTDVIDLRRVLLGAGGGESTDTTANTDIGHKALCPISMSQVLRELILKSSKYYYTGYGVHADRFMILCPRNHFVR